MQCHRHLGTETRLTCGKCGKLICARCVIHHPVGIRCRECTNVRGLPTFRVTTRHYIYAGLVSLGLGVVGGGMLAILSLVGLSLLLRLFLMVGIGYVVGEGVSAVTNHKRGIGLQVVAGGGVVVSAIIGVTSVGDLIFSIFPLAIAVFVAARRVGV